MAFRFRPCRIPDVVCVEPDVYRDPRGFFAEIYKATDFKAFGLAGPIAQVNHSKSQKNVLRGLHYQLQPSAQAKMVTVVSGEIFDVAVDVRRGSPHFGQWVGEKLDADKKNMLYIPEGFAHGFCVLSDTAEVIYFCSAVYDPKTERGLIYNDPAVGIAWPVKDPILSAKDEKYPLLANVETNFVYAGEGKMRK